jgi:hypothetical protein
MEEGGLRGKCSIVYWLTRTVGVWKFHLLLYLKSCAAKVDGFRWVVQMHAVNGIGSEMLDSSYEPRGEVSNVKRREVQMHPIFAIAAVHDGGGVRGDRLQEAAHDRWLQRLARVGSRAWLYCWAWASNPS